MTKHDYHWTFGNRAHVEFPGGGGPSDSGLQAFNTEEGCATISDPVTGALLFYTDGRALYDPAHNPVPLTPPTATLGGNIMSTHSAIIVPPAGGGVRYHIFGVDQWEPAPAGKAVTYTAVTLPVSASNPPVAGPLPLTAIGPSTTPPHQGAAERLAAISHEECDKYWVIAQSVDGGHGQLYAILVDSDAMPTTQVVTPYPYSPAVHQNCVKFSPAGNLFAVANEGNPVAPPRIDILTFNRSTGAFGPHSQITGFPGNGRPYGVEFSPDSLHLYFTNQAGGEVRRHTIGPPGNVPYASTTVVSAWTSGAAPAVGAMQLGPNGRIYGAMMGASHLFEIGNSNHPAAAPTPADVQFQAIALDAATMPMTLTGRSSFGLPTFTRIADSCRDTDPPSNEDRCAELAAEVDEMLGAVDLHNSMLTCKGEPPAEPHCEPVDIPPLEPQVYIRWGDSRCDCIEGDDTEIMHLTICNPYKNVTLSNLVVSQLVVVDSNGNPVPNLPNGDPSIELVPIGPHCFDDIAPCTCVTREFVLWLRGAPGGTYHIRIKGICFDACFHGDVDACFQFEVCKD